MQAMEEDEEGVLLYYKFVSIPQPQSLALWYRSNCTSLALVGRVRVAPGGVNVTIGGTLTSLCKHIDAVKSHSWLGDSDFKLASVHSSTINRSAIAPEVGFNSLAVHVVKELVTLGLHPSKCPSISDAGVHLSPLEFHNKILEQELTYSSDSNHAAWKNSSSTLITLGSKLANYHRSGNLSKLSSEQMFKSAENKGLVILDVRNIYETRIGRFVPPEGVEFLEPQIRQYSDLPHWIDSNAERLYNKHVLIYCTGGVRCELASAYLKKKGKGFQNVFQLSGGIQRYLEAFPDGGFFRGKNFVFDHRVAVQSLCPLVLGMCLHCGVAFDDYTTRTRCSHCRMLVLVCGVCQVKIFNNVQPQFLMCELCKHRKCPIEDFSNHSPRLTSIGHSSDEADVPLEASSVENSKLGNVENDSACCHSSEVVNIAPSVRRKLRILGLHGFRQSASSLKGRLAAFTKKLKGMAEFVFVDAPHEVPVIFTKTKDRNDQQGASLGVRQKKFAWLITPEMASVPEVSPADSGSDVLLTCRNQMAFDSDQYKRQTRGWPASLSKLEEIFSSSGHFDGVLGFSQGAAVAAALCLVLQSGSQENNFIKFNFVILCSGFISTAEEIHHLLSSTPLPLKLPSLHIFADSAGHDRQIVNADSVQLKGLYDPDSATVLTHGLGHIVPSQKEKIEEVKAFLNQFI